MPRALALVALLALAGCYRGPSTDDPMFPNDTHFPIGVIPPPQPKATSPSGIFPSQQAADPFCCWIGPTAAFDVRVRPKANDLIVTLFVPVTLDVFDKNSQRVGIAVEAQPPRRYTLHKGVNVVHVPLKPKPRERVARVVIRSAVSFVPRRRRINGDTRELAVYLKAVRTGIR